MIWYIVGLSRPNIIRKFSVWTPSPRFIAPPLRLGIIIKCKCIKCFNSSRCLENFRLNTRTFHSRWFRSPDVKRLLSVQATTRASGVTWIVALSRTAVVLSIQIGDSNFYGNQRVCRFATYLKRKHSKVHHSHANWSFNQTPKSIQNHRHSKENQTQHDYSAIFQIKPCVCLSLISDTIPRRNVIYFFVINSSILDHNMVIT